MFIKLWNFLRGYVKINISGFSVERLINQAAAVGVVFWDIRRIGGAMSANVGLRDFARLSSIAEKTGTTIAIKANIGLPALARRFKKRIMWLFGLVFFVAALIYFTSFIWQIDVEGNSRIKTDEVIDFLAENDFAVGTWRHGIGYRDVESALMAQFSDIAWASVSINGTRAVVRLVETIPQPEIIDIHAPADVVAAKDGIILHMATSRGTPNFRPGDVVVAGDVLVSGVLAIGVEGEEITYRHIGAASEVWARVYYQINFEIPLVFFEKSFTGRMQSVYSIIMADEKFTLPHRTHDFIYYEVTRDDGRLAFGENLPTPLGWEIARHYELARHLRRRTADEAKAIGEEMILGLILSELADDAELLHQDVSFTEKDDALAVQVFLISHERIDRVHPIVIAGPDPQSPGDVDM